MLIARRPMLALALFFALNAGAQTTNFDVSALEGSLIPKDVYASLGQQGQIEMGKARYRVLNQDLSKDVQAFHWMNDRYKGTFELEAIYKHKDGRDCLSYIHTLRNRQTGQIEIAAETGRQLAVRGYVCLNGNRFERYLESRQLLQIVRQIRPGTNPLATSGSSSSSQLAQTISNNNNNSGTKSDNSNDENPQLQDLGPIGPEHRLDYPKMIGPVALGQFVAVTRYYEAYTKDDKHGKAYSEKVMQALFTYFRGIEKEMIKNDKTIAVDQLGLVIAELSRESAKLEMIKILKARLDERVGDRRPVLEQFKNRSLRRQAEKLLLN